MTDAEYRECVELCVGQMPYAPSSGPNIQIVYGISEYDEADWQRAILTAWRDAKEKNGL